MGLYEVPLSVPWLSFGIGTMLANFVRNSFKHTREECESKRA